MFDYFFQLVAGVADIENEDQEEYDELSQSTQNYNNKYLFDTLIFVLRDYQAGRDIGEDVRHFPKIVGVHFMQ